MAGIYETITNSTSAEARFEAWAELGNTFYQIHFVKCGIEFMLHFLHINHAGGVIA